MARIPTGDGSKTAPVNLADDTQAPLPTYMEETFRLVAKLRCPACGLPAYPESFSLSRDDVACTSGEHRFPLTPHRRATRHPGEK